MRGAQRASPLVVQVALLVAVAFSEVTMPRWILVLVGVVVMLSSALSLRFKLSVVMPFVGCYFVIGLYFVAVADSLEPLLGMLFTLTSWAVAVPIMLLGPLSGPLVMGFLAFGYSLGIAVVHPDWDPKIPLLFLVTCALVGAGSAVLIWQVRGIAQEIDDQGQQLIIERDRALRARAMSEATAEYISVLHDTIVNTFGALARDASARFDPASVRDRCRRDLERVRAAQGATVAPAERVSFRDLEQVGLQIRWAGMTHDDLRRYEALLPRAAARALMGCATEAVLNATKHSGALHVVGEMGLEADEFVLRISDDGRGFDPGTVSERGIADSIRARAERNGIRAQIESAPGEGTSVRLTFNLSEDPRGGEGEHGSSVEPLIGAFTARFGTGWATAVTVIGMIGVALNSVGQDVPAWVALISILGITVVSWRVGRYTAESPNWFVALNLTVILLSNLLLFASDSRASGMFFPSLALTALPTLLLTTRRNPAWYFAAVGFQVATVVAVVVWGAPGGAVDVVSVLLLEAPVLALLCILYAFVRLIGVVGGHLAMSNARASALERHAVRLDAERNVRLQWSASMLDGPLALLQSLADGSLSCADPEVRARCATEEAYLRQLSAMAPDGARMSWWFSLAIAESRKRSVTLLLDAEHADVADPHDARALGELILACIERAGIGEELRVSVVPQGDSVLLLVVGTADELLDLAKPGTEAELRIECRKFAGQVLVEARLERVGVASDH